MPLVRPFASSGCNSKSSTRVCSVLCVFVHARIRQINRLEDDDLWSFILSHSWIPVWLFEFNWAHNFSTDTNSHTNPSANIGKWFSGFWFTSIHTVSVSLFLCAICITRQSHTIFKYNYLYWPWRSAVAERKNGCPCSHTVRETSSIRRSTLLNMIEIVYVFESRLSIDTGYWVMSDEPTTGEWCLID